MTHLHWPTWIGTAFHAWGRYLSKAMVCVLLFAPAVARSQLVREDAHSCTEVRYGEAKRLSHGDLELLYTVISRCDKPVTTFVTYAWDCAEGKGAVTHHSRTNWLGCTVWPNQPQTCSVTTLCGSRTTQGHIDDVAVLKYRSESRATQAPSRAPTRAAVSVPPSDVHAPSNPPVASTRRESGKGGRRAGEGQWLYAHPSQAARLIELVARGNGVGTVGQVGKSLESAVQNVGPLLPYAEVMSSMFQDLLVIGFQHHLSMKRLEREQAEAEEARRVAEEEKRQFCLQYRAGLMPRIKVLTDAMASMPTVNPQGLYPAPQNPNPVPPSLEEALQNGVLLPWCPEGNYQVAINADSERLQVWTSSAWTHARVVGDTCRVDSRIVKNGAGGGLSELAVTSTPWWLKQTHKLTIRDKPMQVDTSLEYLSGGTHPGHAVRVGETWGGVERFFARGEEHRTAVTFRLTSVEEYEGALCAVVDTARRPLSGKYNHTATYERSYISLDLGYRVLVLIANTSESELGTCSFITGRTLSFTPTEANRAAREAALQQLDEQPETAAEAEHHEPQRPQDVLQPFGLVLSVDATSADRPQDLEAAVYQGLARAAQKPEPEPRRVDELKHVLSVEEQKALSRCEDAPCLMALFQVHDVESALMLRVTHTKRGCKVSLSSQVGEASLPRVEQNTPCERTALEDTARTLAAKVSTVVSSMVLASRHRSGQGANAGVPPRD